MEPEALNHLFASIHKSILNPRGKKYRNSPEDVITDSRNARYHYIREIQQYKSKIQFILRKTQRRLIQKNPKFKSVLVDEAILYYLTYRFFWEKANRDDFYSDLRSPLKLFRGEELSYYLDFIQLLTSFSFDISLQRKSEIENLSIKYSFPTIYINLLKPFFSTEALMKNMEAQNTLNKTGRVFFWIERSVMEPEIIVKKLQRSLSTSITKEENHPNLYSCPITVKSLLLMSKEYINHDIIIQDKTSVAAVQLLNPEPNDFILDMCAAPGMKTRRIINYPSQSRLIAGDLHQKRLSDVKFNLKKNSHYPNIINYDATNLPMRRLGIDEKEPEILFDKILLDAPCTGSGTFLNHPELKWRQNYKFLNRNVLLQEKMIEEALWYLKPDGILLYSTCSMYAEEGELQILKFLNKIDPQILPDWINSSYRIKGNLIPGTGRFYPSIHGTNGFFIGLFKKK